MASYNHYYVDILSASNCRR